MGTVLIFAIAKLFIFADFITNLSTMYKPSDSLVSTDEVVLNYIVVRSLKISR